MGTRMVVCGAKMAITPPEQEMDIEHLTPTDEKLPEITDLSPRSQRQLVSEEVRAVQDLAEKLLDQHCAWNIVGFNATCDSHGFSLPLSQMRAILEENCYFGNIEFSNGVQVCATKTYVTPDERTFKHLKKIIKRQNTELSLRGYDRFEFNRELEEMMDEHSQERNELLKQFRVFAVVTSFCGDLNLANEILSFLFVPEE